MTTRRAGRTVRLGAGIVMSASAAVLVVNQAPAAAFEHTASRRVDAVELLPAIAAVAPAQPARQDSFELTLRWPADGRLSELLVEAGIVPAEARQAGKLVQDQFEEGVPKDSDVKLVVALGLPGERRLLAFSILNDLGNARFASDGQTLRPLAADGGLRRHDIRLDERAYWTIRGLGISGATANEIVDRARRAADYVPAAPSTPAASAGTLALVVGSRPHRFGEGASAIPLYAAVGEGMARKEWLRATGAADDWIAVSESESQSDANGLMRPIDGRLTSRFGMRGHPILGFLRFHRGVDYAAAWGTPVRAAADGRIAAAEWCGGYGRQVRIIHDSALATSYSHLAEMRVEAGQWVRKGELIGLVGASGLATGPHLHFELFRGARAIDPLHSGVAWGQASHSAPARALIERYRRASRA